jgi:hypothetical protein
MMSSIVADEKMLSVLSGATGVTEIRDPRGKTIGFFAPAPLERADRAPRLPHTLVPTSSNAARKEILPAGQRVKCSNTSRA